MALDHVKHVEVVALLRTISEQPAFRALPVELQQTAEGWLEENRPPPTAYSETMRSMAGRASAEPNCGCANDCRYASRTGALPDGVVCRERANPSMPLCPVCGGVTIEGKAQTIARHPAGMLPLRAEPGVVAYRCAKGHYHDGKQETGPVPDDVVIREGL